MKKLCFDLDGVICNNTYGDYDNAIPIKEAVDKINSLYKKNFEITIFTARYMGRSNGNTKEAYERGYEQAKKQLKLWGVRHHKLVLGKPEYDIIIDDKGYGYNTNWIQEL